MSKKMSNLKNCSKDWSPAEGVHRKGLSKSIELLSTKMIYLDSP